MSNEGENHVSGGGTLRTAVGAVLAVTILAAGWGLLPEIASRVAPVLTYFPAGLDSAVADPAAHGLTRGEELRITAGDGPTLHAWWVPAGSGGESRESRGALLYFHGNAGHLAGRAEIARRWADRGLDVLLFDYRGYGLSEGTPSESGLYEDARAAYRHLRRERNVPAKRILLHGHSLGGAVAVELASERPAAGLIVSAGFTTLPSLASRLYGWLPDRAFRGWTRNRFDSQSRIREVEAPFLAVAGGRDEIVSAAEVRRLFEAAVEPKRWVEVAEARHNDLLDRAPFWRAAEEFADRALEGTPPSGGG